MKNAAARVIAGVGVVSALAGLGSAQVFRASPVDKFGWGENIGYLNFADAGQTPGTASVRVQEDHLTGFVWGENVGWINLGNGGPYANTNGTNFGVNRDPVTNRLSGYAWGENIGWINFGGGALASPQNPARVDVAARRFRGYAWGENVGWINLDHASKFVGLRCLSDVDGSGEVDLVDFFEFLNNWSDQTPAADIDGVPGLDLADFFAFFNSFAASC